MCSNQRQMPALAVRGSMKILAVTILKKPRGQPT